MNVRMMALIAPMLASCGGSGSGSNSVPELPFECEEPVEMQQGGVWSADTCDYEDAVWCGGESKAAVFVINAQQRASYTFRVTEGFTIASAGYRVCEAPDASRACPSSVAAISSTGGTVSYFAVFRQDGSCGPFELTVLNGQCSRGGLHGSTEDCSCGDGPTCPVGERCASDPQTGENSMCYPL